MSDFLRDICSVACNIMVYWTAIKWYSTIYGVLFCDLKKFIIIYGDYLLFQNFLYYLYSCHYLCVYDINVPSHRRALTKLLTSSYRLRCETGRWERPVVPYENRMCLVCLDKIGDEFHCLLECPRHQSLPSRLISRYYWNRPSMLKLQQLLNSTCTKVIRAVAKFVYKAFNDLWFYVIYMYVGFCMCWYPVAKLCYCVRHSDQMFLSRRTFVRARGPKTIIRCLNPWILEYLVGLSERVTAPMMTSWPPSALP